MTIYRGDTEISNLYIGNTEVLQVYAGDTLIWPLGGIEFFGGSHAKTDSTNDFTLTWPVGTLPTDTIFFQVVYENSDNAEIDYPGFTRLGDQNGTIEGTSVLQIIYQGTSASTGILIKNDSGTNGGAAVCSVFRNASKTVVGAVLTNSLNGGSSFVNGFKVYEDQQAAFLMGYDGTNNPLDNPYPMDSDYTVSNVDGEGTLRGSAYGILEDAGTFNIELSQGAVSEPTFWSYFSVYPLPGTTYWDSPADNAADWFEVFNIPSIQALSGPTRIRLTCGTGTGCLAAMNNDTATPNFPVEKGSTYDITVSTGGATVTLPLSVNINGDGGQGLASSPIGANSSITLSAVADGTELSVNVGKLDNTVAGGFYDITLIKIVKVT
jgi:hypothetical protein